ncbi:PLDc N-terminal domain-containing protein [Halotia wernerae UHCC 0503]|nr:PLDc N-terminal domain-containing protein [Halotia wernerae UHCC 0503]
MIYNLLSFLAEPWFVATWYFIGSVGAAWALYDMLRVNTAVNPPLKAAWPIIIFFFSIIGIALYWFTCRPRGIGQKSGKEKKQVHHQSDFSR